MYHAYGPNNFDNGYGFNSLRAYCCHEFTMALAPYGQTVQGPCYKCGFLPPPGYTMSGPSAPASTPMKTYSDEEIERIKREAFNAGRNASIDEAAKMAALIYAKDAEPEEETRHSLPIHRAIANHRRVGNVYAHRAYWLQTIRCEKST
jgi:hypothetical protein